MAWASKQRLTRIWAPLHDGLGHGERKLGQKGSQTSAGWSSSCAMEVKALVKETWVCCHTCSMLEMWKGARPLVKGHVSFKEICNLDPSSSSSISSTSKISRFLITVSFNSCQTYKT